MSAPGGITGVGYGDPPCNAAGIQEYGMNLPGNSLYAGASPAVLGRNAQGIDVDLWYVQQIAHDILRWRKQSG